MTTPTTVACPDEDAIRYALVREAGWSEEDANQTIDIVKSEAAEKALADAVDCICGHVLMVHDPTGRCHVIVDLLWYRQCECRAFRTPAQAAAIAAAPASPEVDGD